MLSTNPTYHRHTSGIKHININSSPTTFYLTGTHHFPTLRELIDHYHDVSVPNQENVGSVFLRYPIHRDRIDFHALSAGVEAGVASGSDDGNLFAYLTQPSGNIVCLPHAAFR